MVYTHDDLCDFGREVDDAHIPDNIEDIKPRHHKGKSHTTDANKSGAHTPSGEISVEDSDYEDDDDDDDGDVSDKWNVRKYAASAIDVFASVYGDDLLPQLLPHINTLLCHNDWKYREAGVLALGAIAEGCPRGMHPHLPTIIPLLIQLFGDANVYF